MALEQVTNVQETLKVGQQMYKEFAEYLPEGFGKPPKKHVKAMQSLNYEFKLTIRPFMTCKPFEKSGTLIFLLPPGMDYVGSTINC